MKRVLFAGLAALIVASSASAQSLDDLKADSTTSGDVLVYGMGYGQQRFSRLTQINPETVNRLVPIWNYSLAGSRGEETFPLVHGGVVYVTTHDATAAIDALTGLQIWKTPVVYPEEVGEVVCCGIVNRGAALYEGRLFRTTLHAHVLALDAKTGKELWRAKAIDWNDGYSMTAAPLVANGVLITGISGGEFGIRGFLDGWDPATGDHLWRRYTIPKPGEPGSQTWPGNSWEHGGGPTWLTGSYDPELDLVYWGIGNGGPWNAEVRRGDNLYICSVLALRPKTGEIVWAFQFSPNDTFDYDGTNELVHADLTVEGAPRKVIMQANRNGFLYVLDRTSGELLAANSFAHVNWASGIDLKTGRPIESAVTKSVRAGQRAEVWPSAFGGKNWSHMAYSPITGLIYANTLHFGMSYKLAEVEYQAGAFYFGVDWEWVLPDGDRGSLKAIEPLTGKTKWEVSGRIPRVASVLVTEGGILFTGSLTGAFEAFDAESGEKLWQFQTGSGIVGQPITWERDGRQFVTTASGLGGAYAETIGDEYLLSVPAGGSIWTFALIGD